MMKRSHQLGLRDTVEDSIVGDPTMTPRKAARSTAFTSSGKMSGSGKVKVEASTAVPKTSPVTKAKRKKLIVGVDFGTTYSGVSFVSSMDSGTRDIEVIVDWGSGARKNEALRKVPTRIAYKSENPGLKTDVVIGYQVEPGMVSYTWFKLLLDDMALSQEQDDPLLRGSVGDGMLNLPTGKSAQEVATDYLTILRGKTWTRLERVLTKPMLQETPVVWWFTVPANWSDEARELTRGAAIAAGFGLRQHDELFMIAEPEAAAMAAISSSIEKYGASSPYKPKETVLVVDLGGGTTDLSTLKVLQTEPLKLDEACTGIAGKCGATTIDRNLHELMGQRYGETFTELLPKRTGPGSRFMEDFELAKKDFEGEDEGKIFRLRLPAIARAIKEANLAEPTYDVEEGDVLVSHADMTKLFAPVIRMSLALVKQQIGEVRKGKDPAIQKLILCGGLGSSNYVWKKFEEFCNGPMAGKIMLVRPECPWTAVSVGATFRGLEGSVVLSKKARRWYGISLHQQFRDGVDDEQTSFICPIKGKRAPGYMSWHISKGTKFTEKLRKTIKCYVAIDDDEDDALVFTWDLFACSLDTAPTRVEEPSVEKVGQLILDLQSLGKKGRKKVKTGSSSSKIKAQEIQINVVLTHGGERGIIEMGAFVDRSKVGVAKIEYGSSTTRRGARSGGRL